MLETHNKLGVKALQFIASSRTVDAPERAIEKTMMMPVYRPPVTVEDLSQAAKSAKDNTIQFVFFANKVELPLLEGHMIILGRFHPTNKIQPTLDLSKLGGATSGTSRMHATIRRENGEWFLEDLASSNGTWVNGERLAPFAAYRLKSISQVMLANLEIGIVLPEIPSPKLVA